VLSDPVSGKVGGRNAVCAASHTWPKAFEVNSANEYWVKAGSLLHTDAEGNDLRIEKASLVYSSYPSLVASGLAPGFGRLLGRVWRDRGLGDFYGYMLVAEGAAEVMAEADLKPWDLAGPRAVLQEAGARVTDLGGGEDMPARGVLATNGRLHEAVLAELRRP
jgi:histidinol-phosphatase